MRVDNARIEFPPIGPNVKRYGNWVAGTLCIGDEGLVVPHERCELAFSEEHGTGLHQPRVHKHSDAREDTLVLHDGRRQASGWHRTFSWV